MFGCKIILYSSVNVGLDVKSTSQDCVFALVDYRYTLNTTLPRANVKVVKSRVPRDSRSLGGARGVLAFFPFLAASLFPD